MEGRLEFNSGRLHKEDFHLRMVHTPDSKQTISPETVDIFSSRSKFPVSNLENPSEPKEEEEAERINQVVRFLQASKNRHIPKQIHCIQDLHDMLPYACVTTE